jgi:hypothetical protein
MKRAAVFAMVTLFGAAQLPILPTDADAANVRRHLRCAPLQVPTVGFLSPASARWALLITNSWSLTIPKGTTFTVTVDRRSSTFRSASALGPGQTTGYGNYGSKPQSCSVSVPG